MTLEASRPLPLGYLSGQLGGAAEADEFVNWLNSGRAAATTAETHIYVNATSGSDLWDGTTTYPVATLAKALELLPLHIKHNTCIHLSGIFQDFGTLYMSSIVDQGKILLIDGGSSYTIVEDNAGAKFTATGASVSTLVVGAAAWVTDVYAGYIVRVLTGPAAGQNRLVRSNNGTTIVPMRDFATDPGVGATFDIVRPATELKRNTGSALIYCGCVGPYGIVQFQRLSLVGTGTSISAMHATAYVGVSAIVSTGTGGFSAYRSADAGVTSAQYNSSTFVSMTATGNERIGIGMPAATMYLTDSYINGLGGVYALGIVADQCRIYALLNSGSRIKGQVRLNACDGTYGVTSFAVSASHAVTQVDSSASSNIKLRGCRNISFGAIDVSAATTHGMDIEDSDVALTAAVASATINGVSGVYANRGSKITIAHGAAPTISGTTIGNITCDGVVLASTWAAIDAGAALVDMNELVQIKEI